MADVPAARGSLSFMHDEIQNSSLFKKWVSANPNEASHLEAYYLDPAMRPIVKTAFGLSYRAAIDAFHQLGG